MPRAWRFELRERVSAHGEVLERPRPPRHQAAPADSLSRAASNRWPSASSSRSCARSTSAASRAIDNGTERKISNSSPISTCRHRLLPEYREYERTATTVINAYVDAADGPLPRPARGRSWRAAAAPARHAVQRRRLTSRTARRRPARTALSGPGRRRRRRAARGAAARAPPASSPSTWAAPPPTSRLCPGGIARHAPRARSPAAARAAAAHRHPHRRRGRRQPAPGSMPAARCTSGRRARAPTPARPATAAAARGRPSPTPTWSSAAATRTASSAARMAARRRGWRPPRSAALAAELGVAADEDARRGHRRRSPTPPWSAPSASSRSSAATTRATSRWWRSAARARCTPPSWPSGSPSRASSCRRPGALGAGHAGGRSHAGLSVTSSAVDETDGEALDVLVRAMGRRANRKCATELQSPRAGLRLEPSPTCATRASRLNHLAPLAAGDRGLLGDFMPPCRATATPTPPSGRGRQPARSCPPRQHRSARSEPLPWPLAQIPCHAWRARRLFETARGCSPRLPPSLPERPPLGRPSPVRPGLLFQLDATTVIPPPGKAAQTFRDTSLFRAPEMDINLTNNP